MPTYLTPVAHRLQERHPINRLDSLDGLTIGLFHNSKPNASILLEALAEQLTSRGVGAFVRGSKTVPSSPADPDDVRSMAEVAGAVIFATAD